MSKELREKRIAICQSCTYLEEQKCGICGCLIRLKASKKKEECPLGKWPSE
jgi:hypothetical protein|tara:strand:- start:384 stop:536 length:153 start_codon:yes stop_codon:yes gene_type:complete